MKKNLFAIILGGFWLISCQNPTTSESKPAGQAAPIVENNAPVAPPAVADGEIKDAPGQPPISQKTDPKTGGQNLVPVSPNGATASQNLPQKQATNQPQNAPAAPSSAAQPANPNRTPAPHGSKAAPRAALPDDAMCFVARETDGRVFEIRLAMVDEKKVMGDLLVSNVQTGAFVQGKVNGERREMGQILLSWAFNGEDNIRHITNVSYLLAGNKLTQKSRDAEDEGRVFQRIDCSKMK